MDLATRAVHLLHELVAVDSVNPGLVPGAAGERAIADLLTARLSASGFEVSELGPTDRPSLVAVPSGPRSRTIVLNGHLDTVGVAGMNEPFEPRTDGDRLYGRGAADMKGGLAGLIVAAEQLAGSGVTTPVLALVADEEDASAGSEAVIAALPSLGIRPEVCLIAEPTDLALARSLRGFAVIEVEFPGRAAHSSQPQLGVNAVTHLGRFLHAVDDRAAGVRSAGGDLMVTVVHGGSSPFVVPDAATCVVEVRTPAGTPRGRPLDLVQDLLDPEWSASATLVAQRDGWQLDQTGPARDLAAALGGRLGTSATFDAPYWMEAPLWQTVCPTVICGPSGGGLHAVDEWVSLSQVSAFPEVLVEVLAAHGH